VGLNFLVWIALVPLLLFVSDSRVSHIRAVVTGGVVLFGYMLVVAYPLMHIEGVWWAGTHELERYIRENIQFTIGMVIAALWRALCFLPIIFVVRRFASMRYGAIVVASAWVLIEWAFATFGLWGYSAGVLGYSLVDTMYEKHVASFGSLYLLSFLVVLVNCTVAACFPLRKGGDSTSVRVLVPAFLLLVSSICYGFAKVHTPIPGTSVRVAVIGSSLSTEASVTEAGYRSYRKQMNRAFAEKPELIVLPENVFPYFVLNEEDGTLIEHTLVNFANRNDLYSDLLALSRAQSSTTLAIGMHTMSQGHYFNSIVFMRDGAPVGYYRKRVLVPFTEYAPFDVAASLPVRFSRGEEGQYFVFNGIRSGSLICSEIADTNITMRNVPLIIAPSNDSVFEGEYAAPMHQAMARMRAIEYGAYLLRANKGGASSIIDPYGNVLSETLDGVIFATIQVDR
jgi:apolipoprotein N-acyltransferase